MQLEKIMDTFFDICLTYKTLINKEKLEEEDKIMLEFTTSALNSVANNLNAVYLELSAKYTTVCEERDAQQRIVNPTVSTTTQNSSSSSSCLEEALALGTGLTIGGILNATQDNIQLTEAELNDLL